jgi:hypothetical protein
MARVYRTDNGAQWTEIGYIFGGQNYLVTASATEAFFGVTTAPG